MTATISTLLNERICLNGARKTALLIERKKAKNPINLTLLIERE